MDLSDTEKLELEVRRLRAENAALLADPRTSPIADIARVCMEAVRACDEKLDERGLCRCCQVVATFLQTWRGHMETAFEHLAKAEAQLTAARAEAAHAKDVALHQQRETEIANAALLRARAEERERIARAVGAVWPHAATFILGLR